MTQIIKCLIQALNIEYTQSELLSASRRLLSDFELPENGFLQYVPLSQESLADSF